MPLQQESIPDDVDYAFKEECTLEDCTMEECDVLIVGSGLAGLTAASELQRIHARVIVLEAESRPGGRTWAPSAVDLVQT